MESKIENIFKAKTVFEANISIGGCTYLVIYGEHITEDIVVFRIGGGAVKCHQIQRTLRTIVSS